MQENFAHLHLHTEYSLVDGLTRIKALIKEVTKLGMPAIAVTEQGNLYSFIKFYRMAIKYGIKPITGAEIRLVDEDGKPDSSILLLCQDQTGYENLCRIITRSYTEGQSKGIPFAKTSWLKNTSRGLIALSCARDGNIGKAIINGNHDVARENLEYWLELFPDRYYIELQRTDRQNENTYIEFAVELAYQFSVPVVASNDIRFLKKTDFEAHEARVCIQQGRVLNDKRRVHLYSDQQYLRSAEEMYGVFKDIPEAIENTWEIAKRCNLEISFGEYFLPKFPVSEGHDQNSWLRQEANEGLENVLKRVHVDPDSSEQSIKKVYQKRLNTELEVIVNVGFSGYFLIVADFVRWAKQQGIPVGPGRGSGAGSLVAYVLDITELDPLKYELLFERFLNLKRVSMPDFDIDFCMDRRDEVIGYVAERYGRDHVSQIITFGTMAAKAVVRDVGRVLGHSYGFVDQIAKLIPFDLNMTLDLALEEEDSLRQRYKEDEEVAVLIDLAKRLEGLARNAGKHAGGVIIAPKALTSYMPLYCEQGSTVTSSQFDMGDSEAIGLVKFDFLGLRTLTIIDNAVKDANQVLIKSKDDEIDINKISLEDMATFKLIQAMDTTAVFQLESDGMKKLIKKLIPDRFDDLIALIALFRPGPMDLIPDFIERKHGRSQVKYDDRSLAPILGPTYGVMVYQEQVMQIAQVVGGYSLGAADILRRAMGKKKPEEMVKQRDIFLNGARENGLTEKVGSRIFDLMEKFAGYGFNKSHSAAYALLAYQTAWLKARYPSAFMAAVFSSDMDNTDKIVVLREELRRMNVNLLPPSINKSEYKFKVIDEKTILFGLGAIKGVGSAAIENIIVEREENNDYKNLFDLCRRVDGRKVNKRVFEALIRAGAIDEFGPGRSTLMASLAKATQLAEQHLKNRNTGQDDLFGLYAVPDTGDAEAVESQFIISEPWRDHERLTGEKETLGFYLDGHPIIRYENELASIITSPLREIRLGRVIVAGYIESIRTRLSSRGRMAEIHIDDRTARVHMSLYSEVYQRYRTLLINDRLVIVTGEVLEDDYYDTGCYVKVDSIYELSTIRNNCAQLHLHLDKSMMGNGAIKEIRELLLPYRSNSRTVVIEYDNGQAKGIMTLGDNWKIDISDELLDELMNIVGDKNVQLDYYGANQYLSLEN